MFLGRSSVQYDFNHSRGIVDGLLWNRPWPVTWSSQFCWYPKEDPDLYSTDKKRQFSRMTYADKLTTKYTMTEHGLCLPEYDAGCYS